MIIFINKKKACISEDDTRVDESQQNYPKFIPYFIDTSNRTTNRGYMLNYNYNPPDTTAFEIRFDNNVEMHQSYSIIGNQVSPEMLNSANGLVKY